MQLELDNYGFMLILYILCFVYLFIVNTEYVCLILLVSLNLFFILLFFHDIEGSSSIKLFAFYPLEIPARLIILIWWLLLVASNSWLINTYEILRKKFKNEEKINLGSKNNYELKSQIIILIVSSTILFLFFHLLSTQGIESYMKSFSKVNTLKLIISVAGIISISVSMFLNDEFASNMKTITQ